MLLCSLRNNCKTADSAYKEHKDEVSSKSVNISKRHILVMVPSGGKNQEFTIIQAYMKIHTCTNTATLKILFMLSFPRVFLLFKYLIGIPHEHV